MRHEGSVWRQDRRARRTRWGLRAGLAAVLVAWLVLDAIGGPTVGRLSEVQENDNANFLPKQAESILVYDESAKFVDSKALPYFVVIERDSGITPADQDECAGVQPHLRFPGGRSVDPTLCLRLFLVALGIDYSIFLMTRVREESIEHGTRPGIPTGLAVTGGVITSAGVLAATFSALAVLPILFLVQIAFMVAFGVLLDTHDRPLAAGPPLVRHAVTRAST